MNKLIAIAVILLVSCKPSGNNGEHKPGIQISEATKDKIDLEVLDFDQDPEDMFLNYGDQKLENGVVPNIKGEVYYLESAAGFWYGQYQFPKRVKEEMTSSDEIMFITTPDERKLRMIALGIGMEFDAQNLVAYLDSAIGPGQAMAVAKEMEGRETVLIAWETGNKTVYIKQAAFSAHGMHGGRNQLFIVQKNDTEAIAHLIASVKE